jgi:hypothetical protein
MRQIQNRCKGQEQNFAFALALDKQLSCAMAGAAVFIGVKFRPADQPRNPIQRALCGSHFMENSLAAIGSLKKLPWHCSQYCAFRKAS